MESIADVLNKVPGGYSRPNVRPVESMSLEGCRRLVKEQIAPYFGVGRCASYYKIANIKDVAAWDKVFYGWMSTLPHFTDGDLLRAWTYYRLHKDDFRTTTGEFYPPTPTVLEDALQARVREEASPVNQPRKKVEEKVLIGAERLAEHRENIRREIALEKARVHAEQREKVEEDKASKPLSLHEYARMHNGRG